MLDRHTSLQLVWIVVAALIASACALTTPEELISPAATRANDCRPGGYPLGTALFDEKSGFAFERADSVRGDFPDRNWTFASISISPQCETLEVWWSASRSAEDPLTLELLRALSPDVAKKIVERTVTGSGAKRVGVATWVIGGQSAISRAGCLVAGVTSTEIDRDVQRVESLLSILEPVSCESRGDVGAVDAVDEA